VLLARRGERAAELELALPEGTRRLEVEALSLGAIQGLVRSRLDRSFPRPTMLRLHEVSGGNPFYALELVRASERGSLDGRPLPGTLGQLVRVRLEGLNVDVRGALLAVAAIAAPTVELVRLAIGVKPARAVHLLEAAERAGVVTIDGHRVRFSHPLLATGVYAAATSADRRALHRRLARIVDEPERRARHLALAAVHADPETLEALDDAALRARSRGATAAAAELLTLAVRLGGDSPERLLRLAWHHFDSGDPERARTMLGALVAGLAQGRDRAEALRALAIVRLHDDSYLEAAAHLEQALGEVGEDLRLRAQILVELPFVLVNLGRIPDALRLVGDTVTDAERLGDQALLGKALASAVMIRFLAGDGLDEPSLRRALDLEDPLVPTPVMYRPSLIKGLLLTWTGWLDQARETMLSVRRRCLEGGEESDLMFSAFHHVVLECWRGNLADARLIAEDTMERALQLGTDIPLAIALSTRANVAAYAGLEDEARRSAMAALAIFERGSCLAVTVWPMVTLGFLEVSLGNYDAAAATLGPLAAVTSGMGYGEPTAAPFASDAAEAFVGLGRLNEAQVLVEQLERNGHRLDRTWALALGARCRALLLAAQGEIDEAVEAAETALVYHQRLPMPFERARTQFVLGCIQRRRRQKRAAAVALQNAASVFDHLGTKLWSARARVELDRVAVGPAPTAELTPSERRVADLAASGMTNREVAGVLFISPKTVEANLARIYRKLNIRSRAELGRLRGS
jgi:DNA-binding CsgD family transcriptional regulator